MQVKPERKTFMAFKGLLGGYRVIESLSVFCRLSRLPMRIILFALHS